MKMKRLSYVLSLVAVAVLLVAGFAVSALAGAPTVGTGNEIVSLEAVYLPEDGSIGYVLIHKVASEHVRSGDGARVYNVPSGWWIFNDKTANEITSTYENAEEGYRYFKQTVKMTADQVISSGQYAYYVDSSRKWTGSLKMSIDPAMVPAAPEGISYKDGVWTGLDPAKSYRYAPAGMNSTATAIGATGTYESLTASTELDGGLWAVAIAGDGATYYNSEPVLVYVAGTAGARRNLGVLNAGGTRVNAAESASFVAGQWTGDFGNNNYTGGGKYILGCSGGVIVSTVAGALDTAITNNNTTDIEAQQKLAMDAGNLYFVQYAFTADEIIPVNEVISYSYDFKFNVKGLGYTGNTKAIITAYVADLTTGTVTPYVYTTTSVFDTHTTKVDFTKAAGWDKDITEANGYLVALKLQPIIIEDPSGFYVIKNNYNTQYWTDVDPKGYEIAMPVAEKPSLTLGTGNVVSGLKADVAYEYAPVGPQGVGEYTDIADNAAFVAPTGLTAIRVKAGEEYKESDPAIVYAKGNSTSSIWSESSAGTLAVANSAYGTVTFVEGAWSGYTLKSSRYAGFGGYNLSITSTAVPWKGNADDLVKIPEVKAYNYAYQYTAEQIIPFDKFEGFTFEAGARGCALKLTSGKSYTLLTLYVATPDGEIKTVTAQKDTSLIFNGGQYGAQVTVTFERGDFDAVEGYIVGMVINPIGAFSDDATFSTYSYTRMEPIVKFESATYIADVLKLSVDSVTVSGNTLVLEDGVNYEVVPVVSLSTDGASVVFGEAVADAAAELESGLYTVQAKGDNVTIYDSSKKYVYVGTPADIWTESSDGVLAVANDASGLFQSGKWTGYALASYRMADANWTGYKLSSKTGGIATIGAATPTAAQLRDKADEIEAYDFAYAYTQEQIVPVEDFKALVFGVSVRQDEYENYKADVKTVIKVYTINDDGEVEITTVKKDSEYYVGYAAPSKVALTAADLAGVEGYIAGIQIFPYGEIDNISVGARHRYPGPVLPSLHFDDKVYLLEGDAKLDVADPTVAADYKGNITVTNFDPLATYAYSTDEGESWTNIVGNSFSFTTLEQAILVAAIGNDMTNAAANYAEITTPALIFKGASLVLDKEIGFRFYFKCKTGYDVSRVYVDLSEGAAFAEGFTPDGAVYMYNFDSRRKCVAKQTTVDGETLKYFTILVAPKAINTATVTLSNFKAYTTELGGSETFTIPALLEAYKASDDADLLALVAEIEEYALYAANYFGSDEALEAPVIDAEKLATFAKASKSEAALPEGITFRGTSLIVDGQIKIRHYFAIDSVAFANADELAAAGLIAEGYNTDKLETEGVIYYDSKALLVSELGTQQTLSVTGDFAINYSVVNFVQSAAGAVNAGENVKLVNLAKQIFNYYNAAMAYAE